MRKALAEDEIAEVLVGRHWNRAPGLGVAQDFLVGDARRQLGHVDDLMAVPAETLYHRAVDAFIGDQVHADLEPTG